MGKRVKMARPDPRAPLKSAQLANDQRVEEARVRKGLDDPIANELKLFVDP